ncbi:MAG: prepilin-type N-terminal cleavage/methylation domain-containing protein [Planctomycetota bacterium]
MRKKETGFTLIELMIVIAIIAIIAAIAIPNLLSARLNSNETAAIATLRNIISAQAQFQTTSRADENGNGVGEYGTFAEMSGGVGVRGGATLNPPVLSTAFRTVNGSGEVSRSGYMYAIYLPDSAADGSKELAGGGADVANLDADLCETTWCAYAWPANQGNTGNRTFFVNQGGDIITCEDPAYSGPNAGPIAEAAFQDAGTTITGATATGMTGRDGNLWRQAG